MLTRTKQHKEFRCKQIFDLCQTEKTIFDLVDETGLTRTSLNNYIRYLKESDMVELRKTGNNTPQFIKQKGIFDIDKLVAKAYEKKPKEETIISHIRKFTMESLAVKIKESDINRRLERRKITTKIHIGTSLGMI